MEREWIDLLEEEGCGIATVQAELQRAIGFGEAELVANRAGRLTRRQAVWLAIRDANTWLAFLLLAILFIAPVLYLPLAAFALFFGGVPSASVGPLLLSAAVAIGLAFLFRWGATYYLVKARGSLAELRASVVMSCVGPMSAIQEEVRTFGGRSTLVHFLQAGGERYGIPFAAYRVFEDGEQYRAFFMPESKVVVAIETLEPIGESVSFRHHHRGYPADVRMSQVVFLPLVLLFSGAIFVAGLLLDNPPATLLGLGCVLLTAFLVRALVRNW